MDEENLRKYCLFAGEIMRKSILLFVDIRSKSFIRKPHTVGAEAISLARETARNVAPRTALVYVLALSFAHVCVQVQMVH